MSNSQVRANSMFRILAPGFGLVITLTLWLLVRGRTPGGFANGLLIGGLVTVVVLSVAIVLSARGKDGGQAVRVLGGNPDERDGLIGQRALAFGGLVGPVLLAAAVIAIALGAPWLPVLALTLWAQLGLTVAAWIVMARRG